MKHLFDMVGNRFPHIRTELIWNGLSGSDDGGKTVVASDPILNKAMERVGRIFNLKKHTVGKDRVPLVGPGDIEGIFFYLLLFTQPFLCLLEH